MAVAVAMRMAMGLTMIVVMMMAVLLPGRRAVVMMKSAHAGLLPRTGSSRNHRVGYDPVMRVAADARLRWMTCSRTIPNMSRIER